MKTNKITQAIMALALAGMALPALAANQDGWYLGVGGGGSKSHIDDEEIVANMLEQGYQVTGFKLDDKDVGYKLFAGYQFNKNFAIEGGYFDLGKFNYNVTTAPEGSLAGELDFSGWNLDLLGILPVASRSTLFAVIGVHRGSASVDFVGTGAVNVLTPRYSEDDTNYKFGVGYQLQMNDRFAIRLEAERYHMDDAVGNNGDLDLVSLNLIYRFGASGYSHTPKSRTQPVAVQSAAVTEQYCSALEIQFEIAKDDIERVNREHMLVLARFLDKYPETNALIEGHSDNVGNDADNMRLSKQRAQSAVNYLVREHNIARNRLSAVGYGETQPIADNSTDVGKQMNRRINAVIGCATDMEGLQPLPARITLAMELEFDTNDSKVHPKYHDQLGTVAKYLQTHPDLTATLEGHTDNASPDRAQRISRARAQSVADYLVDEFKVDSSRLNVEGFGGTRRNTYNITESERQDNRRVNIILGYPE
ncbi:OmpA family protein [Idiomarina sp. ST10R2A5]|uniref:OmpA family protein n=1 Tax=Idiomarina sp. ST10R2A5 TaxID=3418368 RepID=UPI003EC7C4B5